eukprot:CAMPEP_0203664596 /NCGR_PEP_ID=MMETSP0090-20130426/1990_1 /ASSEMBLY_ACC=CAM_ASM_001088 /TAXON_ID=426623 /ORGANISM="Chaetoceros affinis, Strain CCMP159" /LENGTH=43 /DNA_ID= /DNA_START= /DNA_END= /DNA_ORIENTATION=
MGKAYNIGLPIAIHISKVAGMHINSPSIIVTKLINPIRWFSKA